RTDDHEEEIDAAHHDERLGDADMSRSRELAEQPHGRRGGDERPAPKAHDGHAGRHARTVREPFDQRRDRRNVADAEAAAAEHTIADVDEPKCVGVDADRRKEESTGPAKSGSEHRAPWPTVLDPAAEHGGRGGKQYHPHRQNTYD